MTAMTAMTESNQKLESPVIGAILAGGSSRRMGQPKDALRLPDGRTFANAVSMVLHSCCDEVVSLSPKPILEGIENIPDRTMNSGPLAGIEALLLSRQADRYVVCACDQPLISSEILEALLSDKSNAPVIALQLEDSDRTEHFPLLVRPAALEVVMTLLRKGRRDVSGLLRQLEPQIVPLSCTWRNQLRNMNTPADLAQLSPEE